MAAYDTRPDTRSAEDREPFHFGSDKRPTNGWMVESRRLCKFLVPVLDKRGKPVTGPDGRPQMRECGQEYWTSAANSKHGPCHRKEAGRLRVKKNKAKQQRKQQREAA